MLLKYCPYDEQDDVFDLKKRLKDHPQYESLVDMVLNAIAIASNPNLK